LPRALKARQLSHLGHDRHGADLSDAAQALQCLDRGAHLLGQRFDRRIDRSLQTYDPLGLVFHFV
jgi:hypothetical protein